MTREEVSTYLRTVADRLEAGDAIRFSAGEQSMDIEVPTRPVFEVKVERETATGADRGELSIEFELEWDENGDSGGELRID